MSNQNRYTNVRSRQKIKGDDAIATEKKNRKESNRKTR